MKCHHRHGQAVDGGGKPGFAVHVDHGQTRSGNVSAWRREGIASVARRVDPGQPWK